MKQLLHTELIAAVERRMDPADGKRYTRECERDYSLAPWARLINHVNPSKRGGFCFVGDWIKRGYTDTATLALPAAALVSLERLDAENETYRTYHVAVIHSDGLISLTNTLTDNHEPGWAYRIMPAVSHLVAHLAEYDTTHQPQAGAWAPSRILLVPLPTSPGWY